MHVNSKPPFLHEDIAGGMASEERALVTGTGTDGSKEVTSGETSTELDVARVAHSENIDAPKFSNPSKAGADPVIKNEKCVNMAK